MQGLSSIFTPEQQQNWSQMTGQPHNFSAGPYFGSPSTGAPPNQGPQNPAGVVLKGGAGATGGQNAAQNQAPVGNAAPRHARSATQQAWC